MRFLFTYGTLMKGQCRNDMLNGCKFCGEMELPGFILYDYAGGFPVMFENDVTETSVVGEVYAIPDDISGMLLEFLDLVEGVPNMYTHAYIDLDGHEFHFYIGNPIYWSNITLATWENRKKWDGVHNA